MAECNRAFIGALAVCGKSHAGELLPQTANSGVMLSEKGCPATSFCSLTRLPVKGVAGHTVCPVPSHQLKAIREGHAPGLPDTQKQHSHRLLPARD